MKNLKLILLFSVVTAFSIVSCKKGDTGPQGPAGPDSVTYSNWITLNMTYNETDSVMEQTISAPAITQGILDSGLVLSYFKDDNGGIFNPSEIGLYPTYYVGEIYLVSLYYDLTGYSYRYVLVPGSVSAGNITSGPAKGLTTQELKEMNYQNVQKLLGLSDSSGNY